MKRQIGITISIALASFLVGALLNMNNLAMGNGDSKPWDKVWTAISDLLARVEALEDQMKPLGEVPFNGMTMSYRYYDNFDVQMGERFTVEITFYENCSQPNYLWVAGFTGMFSPFRLQISIDTRKVVGEDGYTIALFPTNVQVGDEITVYYGSPIGWTFAIIGNQTISVNGEQVEAWIARYGTQYTVYHEKKTGILLGATFVYHLDETLVSRSMYLVNTNAPLFV